MVNNSSSNRQGCSTFSTQPRLEQLRQRLAQEDEAANTMISPPPPPRIEPVHEINSKSLSPILIDSYSRVHNYLRISLTERCNFRCTYCMPAEGMPVNNDVLKKEELQTLISFFMSRGISKVRFTGGEPTLRKDLVELVQYTRGSGKLESIGLTTNGLLLKQNQSNGPTLLQRLTTAGLTSLNISLDTINPSTFTQMTRRPASYLQRVLSGLDHAVDLLKDHNNGLKSLKLNCVIQGNVNDDTESLVQLLDLVASYQTNQVSLRFIEYMPFSKTGWTSYVPYTSLLERLQKDGNCTVSPLAPTDPHDTTKWFDILRGNDKTVRLGCISSMSQPFCAGCNRIRLTADGMLKTCLFGREADNVNLKQMVQNTNRNRVESSLTQAVHTALQHKHFQLGGHASPQELNKAVDGNRPMTAIGG